MFSSCKISSDPMYEGRPSASSASRFYFDRDSFSNELAEILASNFFYCLPILLNSDSKFCLVWLTPSGA